MGRWSNDSNTRAKAFLEKARLVVGDKYDLSQAAYVNSKTKISLICQKHGEFFLRPDHVLRGVGCTKCKADLLSGDLTGMVFGRLTVVGRGVAKAERTDAHWLCRCSCGNPKLVNIRANHLRNGKSTTCGCGQIEGTRRTGLNNLKDLTGQRFGRLVVQRRVEQTSATRMSRWECKCDCGETVSVSTQPLTRGDIRSCGCLHSETSAKWKALVNKGLTDSTGDWANENVDLYVVGVVEQFVKVGIAANFRLRKNTAKVENKGTDAYTTVFGMRRMPRLWAFAIEQTVLAETKDFFDVAAISAAGLRGWSGWTELRSMVDPDELIERIDCLIECCSRGGVQDLLGRLRDD